MGKSPRHNWRRQPSSEEPLQPILHPDLPLKVWMDPRLARLPGIVPMDPAIWLRPDDAYAAQMAERTRLITAGPEAVHALLPQANAAAAELYRTVSGLLPAMGFRRTDRGWLCPDGRTVPDRAELPLLTLGHLVQDDLCLMQADGSGQHLLTVAILCFPASWTLTEKLGRPLIGIHRPVPGYAGDLARRVQRLFDGIRPGAPLMRGNALAYADPALFQPRREGDPPRVQGGPANYIRAERQGLVRLPETEAVVFSIRTYVVKRLCLTAEEDAAFDTWRAQH